MNTLNFGRKIVKLRKRAGLTQKELAEKLIVSDKAVSKWETGGGYPEITLIPALAEVLGVSIDYLFKGDTQGIAIAGNILVDVVHMIDKYPAKNMLATLISSELAVGGCVPNTILDIAAIDSEMFLSAIGKVGDDEHGRFVLSKMKQHGIDVSAVKVDKTLVTGVSNVMTEQDTGDRTFFCTNGANSYFDVDDVDVDALQCKIFHIGYVRLLDALDQKDEEFGTRMARLLKKVQEKGIKTSIDVISRKGENIADVIIPALKYCDYVILNEIESCAVTGLSPRREDDSIHLENIRKTMKMFMEYGVGEKVIVHCQEAGFLLNKEGDFYIVPSLVLPEGYIKGSVGAGDAYAAACLYGIYKGYEEDYLLEFAAAAAACNLSEMDSVSGMKTKDEIQEVNKKFSRRVL
ncbi:MAG: helix-turn-helix domain-containing protein [Clostridia bacterium]|nr:helix-turn-helix domain-containing protein [Clostridia bacterium]